MIPGVRCVFQLTAKVVYNLYCLYLAVGTVLYIVVPVDLWGLSVVEPFTGHIYICSGLAAITTTPISGANCVVYMPCTSLYPLTLWCTCRVSTN